MEGRLPGEVKEFVSVPDSASTRFVRAHNLFTKVSLPALSNVQKLMEAQKSPAAAEALLSDPHLKELLGNADLKKALTDPSVTQAFQSGDIEKMLKDPRIAKLLEDPRLSGQMPDLEKALKAEPEKTQP
jgi:hypothetical protein